jgi:hypothetical protein
MEIIRTGLRDWVLQKRALPLMVELRGDDTQPPNPEGSQ